MLKNENKFLTYQSEIDMAGKSSIPVPPLDVALHYCLRPVANGGYSGVG